MTVDVVSRCVQDLQEAIRRVGQVDLALAPDALALADAKALVRGAEQLAALALSSVAIVDRRKLYALDGLAGTGAWVELQQTSIGRGGVALARRLSGLPLLDEAVTSGLLSVETAEVVGRHLAKVRRHVDRPDGLIDEQDGEAVVAAVVVDGCRSVVCQAIGGLADDDPRLDQLVSELDHIAETFGSQYHRLEMAFVAVAGRVERHQLPGALGQLVDALLPLQLEKRAQDARARRGLSHRPDGDQGGWLLRGELDLEAGELLDVAIRAGMAVDESNPLDTAGYEQLRAQGWEAGDDFPAGEGPRTMAQRRHDGFVVFLRRALDAGVMGERDKVAPHVAVTVGLETLHEAPGALPAVAASGLRLPRSLARRWFCDSAATRFVLSLGARVLEVSHTQRTLKAHERRAKHLETGGRCQGAGCTHGPGYRLIPHHGNPWAACGTTSLADTILVCEQTHHDIHCGKVIRLKDGRWLDQLGFRGPPGQDAAA